MNEWMAVSTFPSRICELSSRLSVVIYCAIRCVWMCECECVCRNDCVGLNVCLQCLASSLSSSHLFNIFTDLFFLPFSFAQLIFFPRQSDAFHRFRSFIVSPASICHRHTQNDESNINTFGFGWTNTIYSMLHELPTNPMRLTKHGNSLNQFKRIIYIIWQ